jgi:transposase-like protein
MRTIKEKKAIAKSHIIDGVSKNQLASTHNVAPSTIREWVRKYGASFDAREDIDEKKTVHKGGKVKNEAVNDQLKLFFEVLRDNIKLPPFVVFKGLPGGRIQTREIANLPQGCNNCFN